MLPPKISLRGVTKSFGPKKVLQGVDLDVAPGESMVVIGGSGTGKSVLLKCILGIITPDAGRPAGGGLAVARDPVDVGLAEGAGGADLADHAPGEVLVDDAGLAQRNSGNETSPAEKRVMDTIKWVLAKYANDPNRVYLCGNSMGGSGTLGIGDREAPIRGTAWMDHQWGDFLVLGGGAGQGGDALGHFGG